jgi:O-succinylbenzoic acid--CoA ligase
VIETSGSSGAPKAAMLTQGNVLASATQVNARLGLRPGDLWLCCLPRHHIGGLAIAYRCALAGAAVLLHQGFDAEAVAADLQRLPVTHISLVPPMLAGLLDLGGPAPPGLRVALVGGQALSSSLTQRAMDARWPLWLTYGMTETGSQVATSGVLRQAPPPGVIGTPLPGLTLDCPTCDQAPPGCDQPPRALRLRGDLVMAGYASPQRVPGLGLAGGWLTTADLACRTAAGELRILGRADDALTIGGEQVSPTLVAERLMGVPAVEAAVVVGVADPVWGHRLVGVYAGSIEPAALAAWCVGHLPGPQRPREWRSLDALPLLPSGKYDLQRIRGLVGAG